MSGITAYQKFAVTVRITAAGTQENVVAALSAQHVIRITRFAWSINGAGWTGNVQVQDDSSSPLPAVNTGAFTTLTGTTNGAFEYSQNEMFGGVVASAAGKNLDVVTTASAGTPTGWIYIEGYQRLNKARADVTTYVAP